MNYRSERHYRIARTLDEAFSGPSRAGYGESSVNPNWILPSRIPRPRRVRPRWIGVAIVAIVMLAYHHLAHAFDPTNPCNLPSPPPPVGYQDLFVNGGTFTCPPWPLLGLSDTTSTAPTIVTNSAGITAYWYCKASSGNWALNFSAVTMTELAKPSYLANLGAALAAAAASSSPQQAFNATTTSNVNTPMNDPTMAPVWCPVWPQMLAGIPPGPVVNHVVINPPTFLWRNNQLIPLSAKATIGAQCNCTTPAAVNGKNYCPFTGAIASGVVAECS